MGVWRHGPGLFCLGLDGFEDTAMRIAADAVLGDTVKHEGIIHHLYHEPAWNLGSYHWLKNKSRCEELVAVEGNKSEVIRILKERNILSTSATTANSPEA